MVEFVAERDEEPIFVNGRFLTQPVTGVQRVAREMFGRLTQRRKVIFLAPASPALSDVPEQWDVRIVGKRSGHAWEQIDLRSYLRKANSPLLVSLGNTGPARYKNQIVAHHDVSYIRHPGTYSRAFRVAYKLLARTTLPYARRVITGTAFAKDELVDVYALRNEKIAIIPHAVSDDLMSIASPQSQDTPRDFLVVGSLLPHKNLSLVFEAYEEYSRLHPAGGRLLVAGGSPEALAGKFTKSSQPGIRYLGRVSDSELADLYSSSLALIFASTYEGFGIPPLEAQALGTPVIASDAPAVAEVLGDSALVFDRSSASALAFAMVSISKDAALREDLITRGRANAAQFSWDASCDTLQELILAVLHE